MIRRAIRNAALTTCIAALAVLPWLGRPAGPRAGPQAGPVPALASRSPVQAVAQAKHRAPRRASQLQLAPGAAGMVVARDPETGEWALPAPDQMRAIGQHRAEAVRLTPDGFTEIRRPDGSVGLDLDGRLQSYAVAQVGPDGKPALRCVPAASDTAAAGSAPARLEER